jgi:hypothetical protein
MAINGTEQLSNLSREGKQNDLPTPTMAEQDLSTLHDLTSADNNPPLPYKGPYPFKFQDPLIDSQLNTDVEQQKYVDNLPK